MPLFTFPSIEPITIEAAQEQFRLQPEPAIILDKNASSGTGINFQEAFVVLGHTQEVIKQSFFSQTSHQSIGGLTVNDMANNFHQMVPGEKRAGVRDLYLVACEAGWNDSSQDPCYARRLALALHKKGFPNINVHTITSPANLEANYVGMRVGLVVQPGLASFRPNGEQFGHAFSFLCTSEHVKLEGKIRQLEEEKTSLLTNPPAGIRDADLHVAVMRLTSQIYRTNRELMEESKAHRIMSSTNLLQEMSRPENTFSARSLTPLKNLADELERSKPAPISATKRSPSVTVDNRSALIEELNYLQSLEDKKSKFFRKIKSLLERLDGKGDNWQKTVFDQMDKYHKSGSKLFANRANSDFYGLLVHLVRQHELKRNDALDETARAVEGVLKQENFHFDCVIVNRGKKKMHVTVLYGDEQSEFKLKRGADVEKAVTAFLKNSTPGMSKLSSSASSDGEDRQACASSSNSSGSSQPSAIEPVINYPDILIEKLILQDYELNSAPKESGDQVTFTLASASSNHVVACTFDKKDFATQTEHLASILDHIDTQNVPYDTLSVKTVGEGYQITLNNNPVIRLSGVGLQSDLNDLIQAPRPPVIEASTAVVQKSPDDSDDQSYSPGSNVDESDSEGDVQQPLLSERENRRYPPHNYAYGGTPATTRAYHIWNKASVAPDAELQYLSGDKRGFVGDALKRAILDAFQAALNECKPDERTALIARIKNSPDYAIIKTSQGITTSMFKMFKNTDSVNAFEWMIRDDVVDKGPKQG